MVYGSDDFECYLIVCGYRSRRCKVDDRGVVAAVASVGGSKGNMAVEVLGDGRVGGRRGRTAAVPSRIGGPMPLALALAWRL